MNAPWRRPNSLDRGIAEMQERARDTLANVIEAGANLCRSEPWRLVRAVYGTDHEYPACWPILGKSTEAVLVDCRRKLAAQRELGRLNHWCFDMNTLIALQQAERALDAMLNALSSQIEREHSR